MASSWLVLVLAVLGGVSALPAPAPLAYSQVLTQAVDSYNQRPEVQNAFRLLSAEPEPAPVRWRRRRMMRRMEDGGGGWKRMEEEEEDDEEEGGTGGPAIRECSGQVQLLQDSPEIDLHCSDASSDPVLIQRGRIGRFLRKVRHFRPTIRIDARLRGTVRVRLG
uniref:Uncharacterized protein n=1 Tax=Zosterops lateralis melanops TaxID=1220523 RepID=A0A8D2PQC1_ZOSLA